MSETESWILECLRDLAEEYGLGIYYSCQQIADKAKLPIEELGDFENETGPLWSLCQERYLVNWSGNSKDGFVFAARGKVSWDD